MRVFEKLNSNNYNPHDFNNNVNYFIGGNPITSFNKESKFPNIHPTVFIGSFSSIIGDVTISENVFIACNAVIRADEGTPFFIGVNTNIQDGVILHGLEDGKVNVDSKEYSIYISDNVSCAHGALIHGPCLLHSKCFISFNSIVFNATIGKNTYVSPNAIVTGGVIVADNKFIPPSMIVDTQEIADTLPQLPKDKEDFSETVRKINKEFPASYTTMFGSARCSCGLCYNPSKIMNNF